MSRQVFRLPDLGEGTVAAEIVAWRVQPGEPVAEDQPLVEMATDKAVVEVPSPFAGVLVAVAGQPGDSVAVGAELAVFEVGAADAVPAGEGADASRGDGQGRGAGNVPVRGEPSAVLDDRAYRLQGPAGGTPRAKARGRIMASPATRRRAREAGIDLATVPGSGPGGRILAADLAAASHGGAHVAVAAVHAPAPGAPAPPPSDGGAGASVAAAEYDELPVIGVRRVIAQRMSEAKRNAPHFAYVEEVDVSALEALRGHLNARLRPGEEPYSYLPFIVTALVGVLADFPQCNAHYDAARNVLRRYRKVHVGIATQTPDGLKVPVVRDAGARPLRALAAEIRRVTAAARDGSARRDELGGSTITVTSLGKLGGIVSTPILNLPEVAVVGINKAVDRPVVVDGAIVIRRMMNLSSSFDHRFVDGYDAAAMIQALKSRLEQPATLFID